MDGYFVLPDALQGKCDLILKITAENGARNVRIFDSVIKHLDGLGSNLDLLIEFEEEKFVLFFYLREQ